MANQYTPSQPPNTAYELAGNYPRQTSQSDRRLKKICREIEKTNYLLQRFMLVMLIHNSGKRNGVYDYDYTTMLFGIEPKKQRKKKHMGTIFDELYD